MTHAPAHPCQHRLPALPALPASTACQHCLPALPSSTASQPASNARPTLLTLALQGIEGHQEESDDKEAGREVQVEALAHQHAARGRQRGRDGEEQVVGLGGLLQAEAGDGRAGEVAFLQRVSENRRAGGLAGRQVGSS